MLGIAGGEVKARRRPGAGYILPAPRKRALSTGVENAVEKRK